jgi:selenide,water dikinase
MVEYEPHACTDITGFGLGGHLLEMARASEVEISLCAGKIPIMSSARDYALMGLIPAGSYATKNFCEHVVEISPEVESVQLDLIFDPQTSGGLVMSISPDRAETCLERLKGAGILSAAIIGEVTGSHSSGRINIVP